jgi:hypothetical protein
VDAAIDSYLGNEVNVCYKHPEQYYADIFIYSKAGLFGRISVHEKIIDSKIIEYINNLKTQGMKNYEALSSDNRVGVFVVKSATKNGIYNKINTALKNIEVFNIQGEPIMRRDIYMQKIHRKEKNYEK